MSDELTVMLTRAAVVAELTEIASKNGLTLADLAKDFGEIGSSCRELVDFLVLLHLLPKTDPRVIKVAASAQRMIERHCKSFDKLGEA